MNPKIKIAIVGSLVGVTAMAGAGVAIASWQANGTSVGSSGGHSAAKQPLSVTVTAPTGIYPTQTNAGNVSVSVSNPNPYAVTLAGATVSAVTSSITGCTPAVGDFTFGPSVVGTAVAAKSGGTPATATIPINAVANSLPDACANSDLSFTVTVTGASS